MKLIDAITYSLMIGGVIAITLIIWKYARGLRTSPRDMWLLFIYKVIEYAAYAAMNMTLVLWLSKDCGLGDISAGAYIAGWSMMLSVMNMVAGALVDTIGIKKTLLLSILFLMISRFFMSFVTNPVLIFLLGFVPLAIGFAIVGPLVSVAIKRYTTKEGAALGFGLFYVVMNIAYAIGGWGFDFVRGTFGQKDAAGKIINENFGVVLFGQHFSTYQLIFVIGFAITCGSLIVAMIIRDDVEMGPDGKIVKTVHRDHGSGLKAIGNASVATGKMIASVVRERYFWTFIGMLAMTVFVRFVFFHFHYTFPKYGIRVLGEGAKIGSIYGVLNPVLIVFLVPLVATITRKISSYKLMVVGSIVSSFSCFIAIIPPRFFEGLTHTVLGELIFIKWLRMSDTMANLLANNPPAPEYWPLIVFITVFTIGESIWSPRLMQFTAEIAPKGKEGTYIALSVLPFFAAKFVAGPMSGILVRTYTPLDAAGKALAHYPNHWMVWVWIGGMALLTPIGLLAFRKMFTRQAESVA
jgi:proton-dependent oligopeptide transporter, POT family